MRQNVIFRRLPLPLWKRDASSPPEYGFRMLLLALVCLGTLSGCGSVKSVKNAVGRAIPRRNSELSVKVDIAAEANLNSPIAVDVAFIKDKNLMKDALTMQAQDWFGRKDELRRRFRKSLQVDSWEWVPGQSVTPIVINVPRRLAGAMVFANYASPGSHSAPLPLGGKVSISMQQNDFTLESNK